MSVDVRLRPEAEADLLDAASWYERQLPGLGHRFLDQVDESGIVVTAVMHASRDPLSWKQHPFRA